MSTFSYTISIAGQTGGDARIVDAIVDTGAFYTTLPTQLLAELGVEPSASRRFRVADGRIVDMHIGEARIQIDVQSVTTIVAFGEDRGPSLLGAYSLEGLALSVDPLGERLTPREVLPL